MDPEEVGRFWNANADAWTKLSRAGYDVYRDYLNTPAFFAILPDVDGLSGLDIGCGEGHNTRLLARRRAMVTAIDISEVFIAHAKLAEEQEPLGIEYLNRTTQDWDTVQYRARKQAVDRVMRRLLTRAVLYQSYVA
jgi:2-polyprenyl-3-methyl-5-hydroxy-6-metoxy-1,4-benzoquinol methylase